MKANNVHLVMFSPCGGTARVLRAMAEGLSLPIHEHDITLPKHRVRALSFGPDDLVFFGLPVYGGRMPKNSSDLFTLLEGAKTPAVLVAVYGNRAYEGALLDLHGLATARRFVPIAAAAAIAEHSSAPQIATSRPDARDNEQLADFGKRALAKAENGAAPIEAPGAYPTWTIPAGVFPFPITDSAACTECGQCVQVCPVGAIPESDPKISDSNICIMCAACVKYCPLKARHLGNAETKNIFKSHLDSAVDRKEAEFFV